MDPLTVGISGTVTTKLQAKEALLLLGMRPKVDSPAAVEMKKEAELTLDLLERVK